MVNIWAAIAVAMLSSFSALVATYLNNKSTENRLKTQAELDLFKERDKLRLVKCEELYLALVKWKMTIFKIHLDWISLVDGDIDLKTLLQKAPEIDDIHSLQTSLGVYFPSLKDAFAECREKLKPANKIFFALKDGKEIEKKASRLIILDSGHEFDKSVDELLDKISEIAKF